MAKIAFKQLEILLRRPEAVLSNSFFNPAVKHKGNVFVHKTLHMFITIETEQEIRTRNLYGFAFNTFAQVYVRLLAICNCNSLRENPLVMLQALNCFFFSSEVCQSNSIFCRGRRCRNSLSLPRFPIPVQWLLALRFSVYRCFKNPDNFVLLPR